MRVVIAGYGAEGQASFRYFSQLGHDVTVADERELVDDLPEGVNAILGEGAFSRLGSFDMVVRAPSVSPGKIVTNGKIWSATNEFFEKCPAPIIGVTGTKGKGTTSSLITSLLKASGYTVHLIGNIGLPALAELPKVRQGDIVVFEMSSFQLWDIERSPNVAVVLGIEADHLDVHASLRDYIEAKSNIRRHQTDTDICFFHPTNQASAQIANLRPGARRYGALEDGAVYVEGGWFCKAGARICPLSSLRIPGDHNIENACAALSVASEYTDDTAAIERGLTSFTGLDHRIKLVHESSGIRFYDDSYSSAPAASIAAIRSLADSPEVILLGGYDKGSDFTSLAEVVAETPNIKKAVLYGQTRHKIAQAFDVAGVNPEAYEVIDSLDFREIVSQAVKHAASGDVVILSPGCASFDMFRNFTERGEQFKQIVEGM